MKATWLYVLMAFSLLAAPPLCAAAAGAGCSSTDLSQGQHCLDTGSSADATCSRSEADCNNVSTLLVAGLVLVTVIAAVGGVCYLVEHSHHYADKDAQSAPLAEELPDTDLLPSRAALATAGGGA